MKYRRRLGGRCHRHYKQINSRWAHCRLRIGHALPHEFPVPDRKVWVGNKCR